MHVPLSFRRKLMEYPDVAYVDPAHHIAYDALDALPADPGRDVILFDPERKTVTWWDDDHYEYPTFVDNADVIIDTETVTNTTTETEVSRLGVNETALVQGRVFVMRLFGQYSTGASTDAFTYRVYTGDGGFDPTAGEGDKIVDVTTVQENVTDGPWHTKVTMTVREEGAAGTMHTYSEASFNNTPNDDHGGNVTVDTEQSEEIVSTIQWNNAKADNHASLGNGYIQQMA